MPKLILVLLMVSGSFSIIPPLQAQLIARNQATPPPITQPEPATVKGVMPMREALMHLGRHYRVDILFEEQVLDGVFVPSRQLRNDLSVDQALNWLLTSSHLHFQRITKGALPYLA